MSVIDRARAHYKSLPRKEIKVPEWGEEGEPLVIYASAMTVAHTDRISDEGNANKAEMFVDVLILKAQDADGNMLFSDKDRHTLTREADKRVVSRIALEILSGPDAKTLEGN
ncbi:MAG: hypothetical protein CMN87_12095 [Stappia sp.]|uniref:hypothetical protein n=1 Tax=Stappia sp. TaxID=1870903 RepID=UPI000C4A139E|nr:hypothetical protein [Stappia sp.]MAB00103.1 hypothetical protein [Stappia sp.]MBM20742.1 hypothetical protein [Stappia sp.]|tara:strand:- start:236 stop:571 length:336 start_codon:yes stop_codon:yes gene_type:complete